MKKTLFTIFFLLTTLVFYAQSIDSKKVFGGYQFSQNGKVISLKEMLNTMKTNPEAYQLMKSAKSNNDLGMVLGGIGGFLIGYPIGTALGGGEANWALAGIGAGFIVATIPIASGANRKMIQAVDLYNTKPVSTFESFQPNYFIKVNQNGFGLAVRF